MASLAPIGLARTSLASTLNDLAARRRHWESLMTQVFAEPAAAVRPAEDGFRRIIGFGGNPGHLRLWAYVPQGLAPGAPLVVVLHGCGQAGPDYATGAGWVGLADRHGFALLVPEQKRLNNPKGCFNWFSPIDAAGEHGEAASIRQMIVWMIVHHQLDRRRVFITGLSAGASMAAALLATYPGHFTGAALVAGVPFGAAGNVRDALHAMFEGRIRPADEWAARAREAASAGGGEPASPSGWPRVSLWHGTADAVVVPANADESVKQWTALHAVGAHAPEIRRVGADTCRRWLDDSGAVVVEDHRIAGLGHGTPVDSLHADEGGGEPGPFLLDAGIASSLQIARFWGLIGDPVQPAARKPERNARQTRVEASSPAHPAAGGEPLRPAAFSSATEAEPAEEEILPSLPVAPVSEDAASAAAPVASLSATPPVIPSPETIASLPDVAAVSADRAGPVSSEVVEKGVGAQDLTVPAAPALPHPAPQAVGPPAGTEMFASQSGLRSRLRSVRQGIGRFVRGLLRR